MATFIERQEYKLEILPPFSVVQCRRADIIEKDGVEVGRTYHRELCCPGEDVSECCAELQAVAGVLWTPEVVAAYEAHVAEQANNRRPGPSEP
jgi:hypothetical protein